MGVNLPADTAPSTTPAVTPVPSGTAPQTFDVNSAIKAITDGISNSIAGSFQGGNKPDADRLVAAVEDLFGFGPAADARRAAAARAAAEAQNMALLAKIAVGALLVLLFLKYRKG